MKSCALVRRLHRRQREWMEPERGGGRGRNGPRVSSGMIRASTGGMRKVTNRTAKGPRRWLDGSKSRGKCIKIEKVFLQKMSRHQWRRMGVNYPEAGRLKRLGKRRISGGEEDASLRQMGKEEGKTDSGDEK